MVAREERAEARPTSACDWQGFSLELTMIHCQRRVFWIFLFFVLYNQRVLKYFGT